MAQKPIFLLSVPFTSCATRRALDNCPALQGLVMMPIRHGFERREQRWNLWVPWSYLRGSVDTRRDSVLLSAYFQGDGSLGTQGEQVYWYLSFHTNGLWDYLLIMNISLSLFQTLILLHLTRFLCFDGFSKNLYFFSTHRFQSYAHWKPFIGSIMQQNTPTQQTSPIILTSILHPSPQHTDSQYISTIFWINIWIHHYKMSSIIKPLHLK